MKIIQEALVYEGHLITSEELALLASMVQERRFLRGVQS